MIEQLTAYIQPIVTKYGATGVFLSTLLEEIVAPIPSPLVPLMAGFFFLPGDASFLTVAWQALLTIALPVAFGISIGSLVVYGIGYLGGKPAIEKSKKWIGLGWKDIERIEKKLTRGSGDEIMLFILRMLPIIPGVAISGFCGIVRYPLKMFILITYFGALIRALALGIIGWYVGGTYVAYSEAISKSEKYIFAVLIVVVAAIGARLYFVNKRK